MCIRDRRRPVFFPSGREGDARAGAHPAEPRTASVYGDLGEAGADQGVGIPAALHAGGATLPGEDGRRAVFRAAAFEPSGNPATGVGTAGAVEHGVPGDLSLIHISEPTRPY